MGLNPPVNLTPEFGDHLWNIWVLDSSLFLVLDWPEIDLEDQYSGERLGVDCTRERLSLKIDCLLYLGFPPKY